MRCAGVVDVCAVLYVRYVGVVDAVGVCAVSLVVCSKDMDSPDLG